MDASEFLSRDPEVMSGAVVFKGTRVPVDALFENLAKGVSLNAFLADHPTVRRQQVEAILRIAVERLEQNFHGARQGGAEDSR